MSRNRRRRMVGEPVIIPPGESGPVVWSGLPKTRLYIFGDELVWFDSDGDPLFVIQLAAIEDVGIQARPNPVSVAFVIFAMGLGAIGAFVSESSTLTAFLYVFGLAFLLIASPALVLRRIMIRTRGTITPLVVMDESKEHILAFTASLQNAIRTARRIAPARVLPPGSGEAPKG